MMQQNRRNWTRKPLEQPTYMSLPEDNGGIVLDLSEGGLAFRAAAPVQANGPFRFGFSLNAAPKIEVAGEIVWKDESGKSCGLRFTEMPDELREQIRIWLGEPQARLPNLSDGGPAVDIEIRPTANDHEASVLASRHLSLNAKASPFDPEVSPFTMFPLGVESRAWEEPPREPRVPFYKTHPVATVVLATFLGLVIAGGLATYLAGTYSGQFLIQWGKQVWGGSGPEPVLPRHAPGVNSPVNTTTTTQKR